MLRRNTLNNITLANQRRTPVYQAVITDLAITGNIPREDAEMLLGYKIPEYLKTPDGDIIGEYDDPELNEANKQEKNTKATASVAAALTRLDKEHV